MADPDPVVRLEVAQRLPDALLFMLRDDADWRVRYEVASRIAVEQVGAFANDPDPLVREAALQRAGWPREAAREMAR
jgi:hypothetical protein